MPKYYPIMLDIRNREVLVIGGDHVAAGKAASLHASGARVTVMSEDFCDTLLLMEQQQEVTLRRKAYEPGDLEGAFVVVAATSDPYLVEAIWSETQQRGQLVNIVDVPSRCSFIMPSVLRRDQLTIAVSTEGASPGLAKRIRQRLEEFFSPAYGTYLRLAAVARAHMRKRGLSYDRRDAFFRDFFDSPVLDHLAEGDETRAFVSTSDLLGRYQLDVPATVIAEGMKETQ